MDLGDYVIDTEDDDPDLAVVVYRPDASIEEVSVRIDGEERTVAADNPDYDPTEPAVVVAFVESGLDQHWPEWPGRDGAELHAGARDRNITLYTFPESRLSTVSKKAASSYLTEPSVEMDALRTRLADADWELERTDDGTLIAEKMGERYRISPTGEVDGEGRIRKPLENIVLQYKD